MLPFKRKAWMPLTVEGDSDRTGSKFSGKPWLAKGETWPACQNCGKTMQLFLQLNLQDLPEPVRGQYGICLLQIYYCTNTEPFCEVDCEAFFPFAKSTLLRIVEPGGEAEEVEAIDMEGHFPARTIVGWQEEE